MTAAAAGTGSAGPIIFSLLPLIQKAGCFFVALGKLPKEFATDTGLRLRTWSYSSRAHSLFDPAMYHKQTRRTRDRCME
jgi:hypothetical protein